MKRLKELRKRFGSSLGVILMVAWSQWILKTTPWKWEMRQQKTLLQQKTCCYDMQGQEVSATLRLVFPMQKLFSGRNLSVSSILDSISIAGTILSR